MGESHRSEFQVPLTRYAICEMKVHQLVDPFEGIHTYIQQYDRNKYIKIEFIQWRYLSYFISWLLAKIPRICLVDMFIKLVSTNQQTHIFSISFEINLNKLIAWMWCAARPINSAYPPKAYKLIFANEELLPRHNQMLVCILTPHSALDIGWHRQRFG